MNRRVFPIWTLPLFWSTTTVTRGEAGHAGSIGEPYGRAQPSEARQSKIGADQQSICQRRHQVSMQGSFLPVRGAGGGAERKPAIIHLRDSSGSITSSISKCDALLSALPRSYMRATI